MLKRTLLAAFIAAHSGAANAGAEHASAAAKSQSEMGDFVLAKVAKPSFQHVSLMLDPSKDTFTGQTRITLNVLKPTNTIEISGRDYSMNMAKLVGDTECDLADEMRDSGKVVLTCDKVIPAGKYQLNIDFSAPYNRNSVGLYKTIDGGKPYLFTQFEMSDARRAFPVFDEPEYKIPFQLTITSPKSDKVYANTPIVKVTEKDALRTYEFAKTKPISSYLVAMAVGPFEEMPVEGMSVPGRIITPQGKLAQGDYARKAMPKVLKALEDYFGSEYVYQKLDSVAVPEFPFGAMENAGLVTYREDILLLEESNATIGKKRTAINVIAHELAHQWYGNLVTMRWWNDLWLNEAFATWMAGKITHQLYPEFESHLSLPQNYVMGVDARLSTKPIRKPIRTEDDIMDGLGLAYSKGSAVLSMVENWIGEEAFKQGLRQYMKDFAYKNTDASDLWEALGKASGKDVDAVLKSFIEQSSFPLVAAKVDGKTLTLSQSRFASAGVDAPAQTWSVPVVLKYGKGNTVKTTQVLLTEKQQSVKLAFEPDWIYPDAGAFGYYRWQLSDADFKQLLTHADKVLDTRERLALVGATNDLMKAGHMTGGQLLATLGAFLSDDHPRVVATALGYLSAQERAFITPEHRPLWEKFILAKVSDAITRFGMTPKADEDPEISRLRPRLLSLLAIDGKDQTVIKTALAGAESYLKDISSVNPYLVNTYLNIAALNAEPALIEKMKQVFETTKDPEQRTTLLSALSLVGDLKQHRAMFDYFMSDKLTPSDMRYVLGGMMYQDDRKAQMRDLMFSNFAKISEKVPPFVAPQLPMYMGTGCNLDELAQTQNFFKDKIEAQPAYERALSKVSESVTDCISLRTREQASVINYLKSL